MCSSDLEGLVAPSVSQDVVVENEDGAEVSLALGDVGQATVTGKVVDTRGAAVGDARVRFTAESLDGGGSLVVETQAPGGGDSAGVFAAFLLPGIYDVEVMPPYDVTGVSPVRLDNVRVDHSTGLGTVELAASSRLTGIVSDTEGGPAVNTLVVATEQGFDGYRYYGTTDAQGRFDFAVPDVPMSITLTPGDVGDGAITHVDVETPSAVTGFALDAGTPVTGITSFTGTPVGYATLAVYDAASGLLLGQALTDENGTFSVRVSVPEPSPEDTAGDSATDSGHDSGDSGGSDSGDTADTGGRDSGSGRDTGDTARDSGAR